MSKRISNRKINGSISLTEEMWKKFDALQKELCMNSKAAVVEYLITESDALLVESLKEEMAALLLKLEEKDKKIEDLNNKLQTANERFITYMENILQGATLPGIQMSTVQVPEVLPKKEAVVAVKPEKTSTVIKNSIHSQML